MAANTLRVAFLYPGDSKMICVSVWGDMGGRERGDIDVMVCVRVWGDIRGRERGDIDVNTKPIKGFEQVKTFFPIILVILTPLTTATYPRIKLPVKHHI